MFPARVEQAAGDVAQAVEVVAVAVVVEMMVAAMVVTMMSVKG